MEGGEWKVTVFFPRALFQKNLYCISCCKILMALHSQISYCLKLYCVTFAFLQHGYFVCHYSDHSATFRQLSTYTDAQSLRGWGKPFSHTKQLCFLPPLLALFWLLLFTILAGIYHKSLWLFVEKVATFYCCVILTNRVTSLVAPSLFLFSYNCSSSYSELVVSPKHLALFLLEGIQLLFFFLWNSESETEDIYRMNVYMCIYNFILWYY